MLSVGSRATPLCDAVVDSMSFLKAVAQQTARQQASQHENVAFFLCSQLEHLHGCLIIMQRTTAALLYQFLAVAVQKLQPFQRPVSVTTLSEQGF